MNDRQIVNSFSFMAIGMMLVVLFGIVVLMIVMVAREPEEERIRTAQEATCAANGMMFLDDKYHPPVCAFEVDDQGKRVR